MLLEILEEPTALHETLDAIAGACKKIASELAAERLGMLYFTGSGTSYHAALASHYLTSSLSTRPTNSIPASEFSSWVRTPSASGNVLIAISQSGESVDIVSAIEAARERGMRSVAVTNNPSSPLAKAADFAVLTRAGPENAVTATKTFVCCLAAVSLLDLELIEATGSLAASPEELVLFASNWQTRPLLCKKRSQCAKIEPRCSRSLTWRILCSSCLVGGPTTRLLWRGP